MELMITIALLGIALSIAAPSFWGYLDNLNLRTATREIASDIFVTRERAVSENRRHQITFNAAGHSYSISKRKADDSDWEAPFQTKSLSSFGRNITFGFTEDKSVTFQPRGTVGSNTISLSGSRSTGTITINFAGRTHVKILPK